MGSSSTRDLTERELTVEGMIRIVKEQFGLELPHTVAALIVEIQFFSFSTTDFDHIRYLIDNCTIIATAHHNFLQTMHTFTLNPPITKGDWIIQFRVNAQNEPLSDSSEEGENGEMWCHIGVSKDSQRQLSNPTYCMGWSVNSWSYCHNGEIYNRRFPMQDTYRRYGCNSVVGIKVLADTSTFTFELDGEPVSDQIEISFPFYVGATFGSVGQSAEVLAYQKLS